MARIGIHQASPRIGDFEGNLQLLKDALRLGAENKVDLVVSSEMATTGYYPGDLLKDSNFVTKSMAVMADLLEESKKYPNVALAYGAVCKHLSTRYELVNRLLVIKDGKTIGGYTKTFLPADGIAPEHSHFISGNRQPLLLDINGTKVGFLFGDEMTSPLYPTQHYKGNQAQLYHSKGAQLMVVLSADPMTQHAPAKREFCAQHVTEKYGMPVVYVNQVAAQEHALYDGGSFVIGKTGHKVLQAPFFESSFSVYDEATAQPLGAYSPITDSDDVWKYVIDGLCFGLKGYCQQSGLGKVVVGCSGGMDSAITLALAVRALGPENVLAITMPSKYSSDGSVTDSVELCKNLGIELLNIPIEGIVGEFGTAFQAGFGTEPSGVARENLQARARGTLLMTTANQYGYLLLATGNKSEGAVGYFTLYGDSCGGLNLIGDLFKTEVYEMGRVLNMLYGRPAIPKTILEKAPSAELAPGQKDQDNLPPYPVLDFWLRCLIEGHQCPEGSPDQAAAELLGYGRKLTDDERAGVRESIVNLVQKSAFKRLQVAPTLRVKPVAFGPGLSIPLSSAYKP